jgi:hypothetical protein
MYRINAIRNSIDQGRLTLYFQFIRTGANASRVATIEINAKG